MAASYDLILKGGTVVNHDGEGVRDVAVAGGRIAGIGELSGAAAETVDCCGLHVLPGVIDSHVHMREPGLTHKEDLETGSHAAVMGGVTAVFEMPNTEPATTNAGALADKVKRAHHRMHCDFAFYIGATRENTYQLGDLERLPGCLRGQGVHGLVDRLAADRGRRGRAQRAQGHSPPGRIPFARTNTGCANGCTCASRAIRARIRCGGIQPPR